MLDTPQGVDPNKFTLITPFSTERDQWMHSKCVNIHDHQSNAGRVPSRYRSVASSQRCAPVATIREYRKDQETSYPRWIVEAWERLLTDHFKDDKDPEDALISRQLWFDDLPAVMRVRITTPNVLKVLRKRDPGVAKPYNFALSPILIQPSPDCTLVAPASKHPEEWLTREYKEIHSGETVMLGSEYHGKTVTPQTLSSVIWRHFLHPEDKSLSPDGEFCNAYTRGLEVSKS